MNVINGQPLTVEQVLNGSDTQEMKNYLLLYQTVVKQTYNARCPSRDHHVYIFPGALYRPTIFKTTKCEFDRDLAVISSRQGSHTETVSELLLFFCLSEQT